MFELCVVCNENVVDVVCVLFVELKNYGDVCVDLIIVFIVN